MAQRVSTLALLALLDVVATGARSLPLFASDPLAQVDTSAEILFPVQSCSGGDLDSLDGFGITTLGSSVSTCGSGGDGTAVAAMTLVVTPDIVQLNANASLALAGIGGSEGSFIGIHTSFEGSIRPDVQAVRVTLSGFALTSGIIGGATAEDRSSRVLAFAIIDPQKPATVFSLGDIAFGIGETTVDTSVVVPLAAAGWCQQGCDVSFQLHLHHGIQRFDTLDEGTGSGEAFLEVIPLPEPRTGTLLGAGLLAVAFLSWASETEERRLRRRST